MSDMTDEQAALAWLDKLANDGAWINENHARTLKRMLAQPRLPEEPDDEALRAIERALGRPLMSYDARRVHRALYDFLTKPRTKTVEVWRIEAAILGSDGWVPACSAYRTEEEAARRALDLTAAGWRAVRVTGPHKQEVPA